MAMNSNSSSPSAPFDGVRVDHKLVGSRNGKKLKYKKPAGAPKRFKSSYIFFSTFTHKEIQKKLKEEKQKNPALPAVKTTTIAKMVSKAWKEQSQSERKKWEDIARKDKDRYLSECDQYKGPWKVLVDQTRKRKDPNAPKRPMSSYLAYSHANRRAAKLANPEVDSSELSRILCKMWKNASEEEREPFIKEELKLRQEYKIAIAAWRADEKTRTKRNLGGEGARCDANNFASSYQAGTPGYGWNPPTGHTKSSLHQRDKQPKVHNPYEMLQDGRQNIAKSFSNNEVLGGCLPLVQGSNPSFSDLTFNTAVQAPCYPQIATVLTPQQMNQGANQFQIQTPYQHICQYSGHGHTIHQTSDKSQMDACINNLPVGIENFSQTSSNVCSKYTVSGLERSTDDAEGSYLEIPQDPSFACFVSSNEKEQKKEDTQYPGFSQTDGYCGESVLLSSLGVEDPNGLISEHVQEQEFSNFPASNSPSHGLDFFDDDKAERF